MGRFSVCVCMCVCVCVGKLAASWILASLTFVDTCQRNQKLRNISSGAGLGPTKVSKICDTFDKVRKKCWFRAWVAHIEVTKSILFLRIEWRIGRFAGFSAAEYLGHFRCSRGCTKITTSFFLHCWLPYCPPERLPNRLKSEQKKHMNFNASWIRFV